jgi:hypothetical protein
MTAPQSSPQADEALQLTELFSDREPDLLALLSGQLSVLKNQASMLMGLAGLTVTVTGFSGHHMVRAGPAAWGPMVGGIFAIMIAVLLTLRVMLNVRWVTQDLVATDLCKSVEVTIQRRNQQQRWLGWAGGFVALGLFGYLIAVVVAALRNGGAA